MVAGPIEEQVERAIQVNRIVLLVLSKDSVESDWVEWEVKKAHEFGIKIPIVSVEATHLRTARYQGIRDFRR